jgi:Malate:quinone oxidoreductase (Mqo)
VKSDNLLPLLAAGRDNIDLTRHLIGQVLQSPKDRLAVLKEFVPTAKRHDWRLEVAGQRVQTIKKDPVRGGILQFGTEALCLTNSPWRRRDEDNMRRSSLGIDGGALDLSSLRPTANAPHLALREATNLPPDECSKASIETSVDELKDERAIVGDLIPS